MSAGEILAIVLAAITVLGVIDSVWRGWRQIDVERDAFGRRIEPVYEEEDDEDYWADYEPTIPVSHFDHIHLSSGSRETAPQQKLERISHHFNGSSMDLTFDDGDGEAP